MKTPPTRARALLPLMFAATLLGLAPAAQAAQVCDVTTITNFATLSISLCVESNGDWRRVYTRYVNNSATAVFRTTLAPELNQWSTNGTLAIANCPAKWINPWTTDVCSTAWFNTFGGIYGKTRGKVVHGIWDPWFSTWRFLAGITASIP